MNNPDLGIKIFKFNRPFKLESGKILEHFHLAYTTHGNLNENKSNVVWVFHALTANSNPVEWWPGLVGNDKLFDPANYFIICVNMPGSCYGSISPFDINDSNGETYFYEFPFFTTRDMIHAYQLLKIELGIQKVFIGIGGSMGGQQLLEWAIEEPALFQFIIPIATNAVHSPWAIAFNASQRWCIENDSTWGDNHKSAGLEGMKIARSIALISYRQYGTYQIQEGFEENSKEFSLDKRQFKSESYQYYQGEKLAKRFNAFSYYFLSKSMDFHNVGRNRNGIQEALSKIISNTLVISISSDLLFPEIEQREIFNNISSAHFSIIDSQYGHDGFLLEYRAITNIIRDYMLHYSIKF